MRDATIALCKAANRVLGIPSLGNPKGYSTEDLCAVMELEECINWYRRASVPVCPGCGSRAAAALVCKRCKKTASHCTCMDREAIRSGACNRVPCEHPGHPHV